MTNLTCLDLTPSVSPRELTGLEQAFLGVPQCLTAQVWMEVSGDKPLLDNEHFKVRINFENLWLTCFMHDSEKRPLSGTALMVQAISENTLELSGPDFKPMQVSLAQAKEAAKRCVKELAMAQKISPNTPPLLLEGEEASPSAHKSLATRLDELVKFTQQYPQLLKAQQETFGQWLSTTLQFKAKDGTSYDVEVFPVVVGLMKQAKSKQTAAEFIAPVFAKFRAMPEDMVAWLKSLEWKVVRWGATLLKDPQGHGYGALFENEKNQNGVAAQTIWQQCEFQGTVAR